jgi:hypothetical protein
MLYPFESLHPENGSPLSIVLPRTGYIKPWLGTLAVAFAFAAAAGPAAATPSCRLPGGHTIATGRIAKLIAVPTPGGSALFACIRRSGRKVALDDGYADARVAGRFVAWQRPGRPGKWRIAVHDLRTGKERLVNGHVAAHSLGLTGRGSIVWAQELDGSEATPLFANEIQDGGRLLDGGDVDAASVELAGRRVSWLSADQQRAAILY